MASLTGASIASSYEQLLALPDGGLNGTTLVAITDGDSSTEVGFKISTNALSMNSTNQLQFGDTGTYIHQSADGVLDLVSDTEIEINATTIDINGAVDISGDTNLGGGLVITNTNAGAGANPTVSLIRNSASPADDDYLGMIEFKGEDSASASESYADITAQIIDEANSSEDGSLRFRTMKAGTLTETMRLTSGLVGIGISPDMPLTIKVATNEVLRVRSDSGVQLTARTDDNGSDVAMKLRASSFAFHVGTILPGADDSQDIGSSSFRFDDIYATNGTIQTSDKNLKDNIADSSLGLDFLNALRPVEYKWKDYNYNIEIEPATESKEAVVEKKEKTFVRKHFGLIAQEVEQVLKDSSLTNNDFAGLIYDKDANRYGLRYHELIAPLIKAVQELSKKVTDLENK